MHCQQLFQKKTTFFQFFLHFNKNTEQYCEFTNKQNKKHISFLDYYENNLKLLENKKKIEKLIKNIDVNIKEKIEELI